MKDWNIALEEYIDSKRGVPFAWGENDCVMFAAGWVKLRIGFDVLRDVTWNGKRDAVRLLREKPLQARIDELFDRRPSINYAQRGDLMTALNERGEEYVGICVGNRIVAPCLEGIAFAPYTRGLAAWEIR